MRYYIIAGEASGDLHGAKLMRSIKQLDSQADFRYWGGDLMQAEGGQLVNHYRNMAFMGLVAVLMNLRTIMRNMRWCKKDIEQWQPDVLVLIDYPGFNLRIAKFAKKLGLRVHYYISPKIWAWKKKRVYQVKAYIDRMYTIFPFETEFYAQYDYRVNYVGNPLMDELKQYKEKALGRVDFMRRNGLDEDRPVIALLPGSRSSEIKHVLPLMLSLYPAFQQDYQLVVSGAPGQGREAYEKYLQGLNVSLLFDQTYDLVSHAAVALVTSGTATLETALLRTPQVVCYKMPLGRFSHWVLRKVLQIEHISLVNILASRTVVQELIQQHFTTSSLHQEVERLLHDKSYREDMLRAYDAIAESIGEAGASDRAAQIMVEELCAEKA